MYYFKVKTYTWYAVWSLTTQHNVKPTRSQREANEKHTVMMLNVKIDNVKIDNVKIDNVKIDNVKIHNVKKLKS